MVLIIAQEKRVNNYRPPWQTSKMAMGLGLHCTEWLTAHVRNTTMVFVEDRAFLRFKQIDWGHFGPRPTVAAGAAAAIKIALSRR